MTVYEKAIETEFIPEGHNSKSTFDNGEVVHNSKYTLEEHVGAVGTHDGTHPTDPNSNMVDNPKGEQNQEKKPNENELEFYREFDKKKDQ